jgi:transposase-like protein
MCDSRNAYWKGRLAVTSTKPTLRFMGDWYYLYRAIDRSGALVEGMFREHSDMAPAQAFFRSAKTTIG